MGYTAVFAAALAIAACDNADRNTMPERDTSAVGTTGSADVSSGDRDLVQDLSIANMAEIEFGKLAAAKAMNAEVKKFGQKLTDEHTKALDGLKAVASQHKISVGTALDEEHERLRMRLSGLSGGEFDREFIDAMIDGHQEVLDALEPRVDESNMAAVIPEKSDNAAAMAINRWAAEAYPAVHAHLEAAKAIKAGGRMTTTQ
jgi:putative membrane protein